MAISEKIKDYMTRASWIRRMFEQGAAMKKEYGEENVFDFTLGNPIMEPPREVQQVLKSMADRPKPGLHRYMSNAGFPEVRQAIAAYAQKKYGLSFERKHVVMSVGAGGALNAALKAILDDGDEVIIIAPYFVEYLFYIDNHNGKSVSVDSMENFELNVEGIERAVNERTKAVIINSPHNPTGVIYDRKSLDELSLALRRKEKELGREIYIISDEPYRKIVFDGMECPSILHSYKNSIVVTSHSKDLSLPGERIGYALINSNAENADALVDAMTFTTRILGFVNAPAMQQIIAAKCCDVSVNVSWYQEKRDLLYDGLTRIGYETVKPQGAFYMFPKSPIKDDQEFTRMALKKRILIVPGIGFGKPGHFRLSYCTLDNETIRRSMDGFEELYEEAMQEN